MIAFTLPVFAVFFFAVVLLVGLVDLLNTAVAVGRLSWRKASDALYTRKREAEWRAESERRRADRAAAARHAADVAPPVPAVPAGASSWWDGD